MKHTFIIALTALFSFLGNSDVHAQISPVKWSAELIELSEGVYSVQVTADIETNWFIYSQHIEDGGPIPTEFELTLNEGASLEGDFVEPSNPIIKMDEMFDMELTKFNGQATFTQKVISENALEYVNGYVTFMTCDDSKCLAPTTEKFTAEIK